MTIFQEVTLFCWFNQFLVNFKYFLFPEETQSGSFISVKIQDPFLFYNAENISIRSIFITSLVFPQHCFGDTSLADGCCYDIALASADALE